MSGPCIHILFEFRESPYGGANQFLKALRDALARARRYAEEPAPADVVLFNSHHDLKAVMAARRAFPDKPFIHRVDGPMRLYNDPSDKRDALVIKANNALADATVFQSQWSLEQNLRFGWPAGGRCKVIGNAPDPQVFNNEGRRPLLSGGKPRLIAASWSTNPNKGFDVYDYLDEVLDYDAYDMTFVGNSPVTFRNIHHLPPCSSEDLAREFKRSDIFITASRHDPCSNSLVEALHCGLPAIARRDGGHPEVLGSGGELFDAMEEVPELIERLVAGHAGYAGRIEAPSIDEVAGRYAAFAESLAGEVEAGHLMTKRPSFLQGLFFGG